VIIVGPSGVGHAVDSFNLNSSYFESRGVPVLGAIFNKLETHGYYSLGNCSQQVTSYFQQHDVTKQTFGFLPIFPQLGQDNATLFLDEFFNLFAANVNIDSILQCARKLKNSSHLSQNDIPLLPQSIKRSKFNHSPQGQFKMANKTLHDSFDSFHVGIGSIPNGDRWRGNDANVNRRFEQPLSREQIEEKAAREGAKTSC
jgi:hypothetical protein